MSTDLIIPNKPTFLAKAVAPATLAEFAGGVQAGGLALPVLSIRGKMFRARLGGEESVLTKDRELQVILVAARPHVSKRYYDSAYQAGSVEAPACASLDGKTPTQGDRKQSTSCATCPHNVFGSKGKGKACNDYKRVIVLPLVNGKPVNTPCVLDIPATSLRTPKELRGGTDKMLAEYLGALSRHQIDPTTVVSTISFTAPSTRSCAGHWPATSSRASTSSCSHSARRATCWMHWATAPTSHLGRLLRLLPR